MRKNVEEFINFRYEKLKLLKRSERGEVWLARARQGGDLVILKRVATINLPYAVLKKFSFRLPAKVLYCAEDESETVIAEEFIQGENLSERKNPLSESQAREILLQMCDGLAELHAQNIIHRDIKPSNMILQGERVRLIDFDAARIFKDGKETDTQRLGTEGYAPPEQFGFGQTDARSDIFSLGVTMKNLLGDNCGGLKSVLDKCIALDPAQRFQSVDELKAALTTEKSVHEPRSHKKFLAASLLTAGIFFFANTTPLNRNENFTEEIPAQVEELPAENSPPEKISATAKVEPFKFPEIVLPPINSPPAQIEPPKNYEPPPRKTFSGLLKTKFYLNGELFNQFEHKQDKMKISRADWLRTQARLHITNDTGQIWQNPTIKFIFGQNWGDNFTDTKTLPALNVGEAVDFVIPFNLFTLSDRKNTGAYIQIYLEGDESKMDEHYWCVWFDVTD